MPPLAAPPSFCIVSTYFFIASDGCSVWLARFLRRLSSPPPPSFHTRPSAFASAIASALTLEYLKRWNQPIP